MFIMIPSEMSGFLDVQLTHSRLVPILLGLGFFYALGNLKKSSCTFPLFNPRKTFEFSDAKAKERYRANAKELLRTALEKNKAFFLTTDNGTVLILANKYAREIYNNPYLNVSIAVGNELHCNIPGMEAYKVNYFPAQWGPGEIRKHLGTLLGMVLLQLGDQFDRELIILNIDIDSILPPLSAETSALLNTYWTCDSEWHRLPIRDIAFDMVAQATATLRSGKELSQNREWERLCVDFSIGTYIAARDLDKWPTYTHGIAHWFLPSWKKLRSDIKKARAIFAPAAEAREKSKAATKSPKYDDLIEWLEEGAQGRPFDAVMAQLITGQAMLLGPADLFPHIIQNICKQPELVKALRAEILSVVGKEGLTKISLSKLKLMDSVNKESHRMRHLHSTGMRRYAERSITLLDGVVIPRGTLVAVAMDNMWDGSIYPNPEEFQGDRFLSLRKVHGQEVTAKFSSPSINHIGFGYGRHTCPGRHYADVLIKVLLCHILLKYDLRLVDAQMLNNVKESSEVEIEVQRRQEELVL